MFQRVISIAFAVVIAIPTLSSAQLRLPAIFDDGLVLQRNKPVTLWGWAAPNQAVDVRLAEQNASTTADADGKWKLELDPLPAGGPYKLEVKAGSETLTRSDVLSGEVWLASGQSNMDFWLSLSINGKEEVAAANYPEIRVFDVARKAFQEKKDDVRGEWVACTPETMERFSAVAYYFGRRLHQELDVPIGLIDAAWGGTSAEAWTSREVLEAIDFMQPNLAAYDTRAASFPAEHAAWEKAVADSGNAGATTLREPVEPKIKHSPGGIFNGMVRPLIPYSIAGIVWYQGESNANRAGQYRTIFPALITDWRQRWGDENLPFYFVQLANFMATDMDAKAQKAGITSGETTDTPWSHLRDAQLFTLRTVPHTGMAVTIDIGDSRDVHPKNKRDVGERLARWALAKNYDKVVVTSGPLFNPAQLTLSGQEATVYFDHATQLKTRDGGPLQGFTVAAQDEKFVKADARILDDPAKPGVVVSVPADAFKGPIAAVRYAWKDDPQDANLVNEEGLPASPFRTDSFDGPRDSRHWKRDAAASEE